MHKARIAMLSALFLSAVILMPACRQGEKEAPPKKTVKKTKVEERPVSVPVFNADSAFYFVGKQLSFGYRIPGTQAHAQTARWIEARLRSYGAKVKVQKGRGRMYNDKVIELHNIIASLNPGARKRILLMAHWDSRRFADHDPDPQKRKEPVPGANDGASGVAVLMEMVRAMQSQPLQHIGIDVVLVDAEDQGTPDNMGIAHGPNSAESWGLGAQYWSRNPHRSPGLFRYGILLDMVGAAGATFPRELYSLEYAPQVVEKVWSRAAKLGYGSYFIMEKTAGGITDDHYFVNTIAHIPMIDIIHYDVLKNSFFPYWHTTSDDLTQIDKSTLNATGRTLLELLYREDIAL